MPPRNDFVIDAMRYTVCSSTSPTEPVAARTPSPTTPHATVGQWCSCAYVVTSSVIAS